MKTAVDIVTMIEGWDRVGCLPFTYLSRDIIYEFDYFMLYEFDWQSNFINWNSILGYGVDYKNRINKKVKKQHERHKYYKYYEKDIPPVILDDSGNPLDGYHRLAKFKHEKLSFKGYVGVRSQ